MRNRIQPLLCEFHAHTRWSDGHLSVRELVDLYGARGFDVLCVTDHTVRSDDPWLDRSEWSTRGVRRQVHASYVADILREAARGRALYDLLVLPGVELTYNAEEAKEAAHAVAVGLDRFVSVDEGIVGAIETARGAGAAIIAAHPFDDEPCELESRRTRRFAVAPAPAVARAPVRALQPHDTVQLGRSRRSPRHRRRRLSPAEAPRGLEDAAPLREGRRGSRRLPSLCATRLSDPSRGRARSARCRLKAVQPTRRQRPDITRPPDGNGLVSGACGSCRGMQRYAT